MTLPTGESPVSFSQIRDEFGTAGTDSATAPVRLGQYRSTDPAFTNETLGELPSPLPLDTGIPTSGSINVDAFHGKKLNTVIDLYETGSSNYNHNVKTNRFDAGNYDFVGGYRDSLSPATWQGGKKLIVHINNTFGSNGASNVNDVALTIGDGWPANTDFQIDFQDALGKNHAKYFDKNGWFYFTKQHFDLLYPSYGDTYPMFLGSIGMTYEQAGGGIAGLGVKNDENLVLTLKDRIEHHYTTGISTVEMASKNRIQLNKNYQTFFSDKNLKYKNFVLEGDIFKINDLKDFLKHSFRKLKI